MGKIYKQSHLETLPFDVHEQTNEFLMQISNTASYKDYLHNIVPKSLTELEKKLFKEVNTEILYRKHIGAWNENTSTNISSVSSQEG